MTLSFFLCVVAMVLFFIAIFPVPARFNLVAAGLFCLTAAAAISGGVPHL